MSHKNDSTEDNYDFLTHALVSRTVLTMAVPTIVTMLVTSLYNMADTFFVGQLDTQSTAAVGIVFSMMFAIQAFGFFFGHGSGNFISRELGAHRHDTARRMAANGFFLSFFFGIFLALLGEALLEPLTVWLGSTPTIRPYTERYMGIILLGAPFLTSSLTLNNQMRLQGNARLAMIGITTGAVINVALDPLLIFVFDMGVAGAAIATVTGQFISFLLMLRLSHSKKNIGIAWKNFSPSWTAIKETFYGGSPSLSRQGLGCIATIALNVSAGNYGDEAIAAMSIVTRITMLIMAAVVGLGQGFQPTCGFCYGAGLFTRLKAAFWFTVKIGTIFLVICCVVGIIYAEPIVRIFRDDDVVVEIGARALRWQLLAYPLNAFSTVSNMLTQTCRYPWRANLLASARRGLFFIPAVLLLPLWLGLTGVELAQCVSDVLGFLLTVPIMVYTLRDLGKPHAMGK